ncbi:MAG: TetR/AcrR family transcriptional regulator [Bacteroidia bacterium]|jgi:TetR/AcrR family transcriptional regulator
MVENSNSGNSDKTVIILAAAQKRFAHYGLLKTTMNDIAEDIGMSKASLYYYFADKETIFQDVIRKEQREFVNQIEKFLSDKVSGEELLITYVKKRLSYFQTFLNLSKLSSDSIKGIKPIFSQLFENFKHEEVTLLKKIIKNGIENGEFEKVNVTEFSELFISLIQGLRSNLIIRKELENLDKKDYQILEKQFINVAKIFSKGIKK